MTGLEVVGVLWVLEQVLGNEAFMICVSGC